MSGRPNFHEKELNQFGLIESIDVTGPARRFNYTALCGCGQTTNFSTPNGMPGRVIAQRIERQGWKSKPPKWKCADCQQPRPRPALMIVPAAAPQPVKEPEPMPALAEAVPQPKMSTVRVIINLLEQHFDTKAGNYAKGWSDRKVSEQAGVPMIQVANIREEGFGPIKADPELIALREEGSRLESILTKATDDLIAWQKRIESYAVKAGVK